MKRLYFIDAERPRVWFDPAEYFSAQNKMREQLQPYMSYARVNGSGFEGNSNFHRRHNHHQPQGLERGNFVRNRWLPSRPNEMGEEAGDKRRRRDSTNMYRDKDSPANPVTGSMFPTAFSAQPTAATALPKPDYGSSLVSYDDI